MTAPLIVVPPVSITDDMLTDTDVPDDTNPAWSAAVTYGLDDLVYVGRTVYKSVQAGNLNRAVTNEDWWAEYGPTNLWACFDGSNSTQTRKPTSMFFELEPVQAITSLALLNVVGCNTARALVVHPTLGTLKDQTYTLASLPEAPGWWEWTFGERSAPTVLVALDIPPMPGCTIRVELDGTTELALGVLQLGVAKEFGEGVLQGARLVLQDFSKKKRDEESGETFIKEGEFADDISFNFPIQKKHVGACRAFMKSIRATPSLWIIARDLDAGVVFGFFREFEVVFAYNTIYECSVSIEGMT